MADMRPRNYLALGLLIMGKVLGIAGLVVGSTSRVLGGTFLVLDGVLIVGAIVVCLGTMRARAKEDAGQKAVLRQMMKEGTLEQHLRDLKEEQRSAQRSTASIRRNDGEAVVHEQSALS